MHVVSKQFSFLRDLEGVSKQNSFYFPLYLQLLDRYDKCRLVIMRMDLSFNLTPLRNSVPARPRQSDPNSLLLQGENCDTVHQIQE